MLEKIPEYIDHLRKKIIDPAIQGLVDGVRAAKDFLLREIETPIALAKAIEKNCAEIEKHIPHLPDELKEQLCEDIDLTDQPFINPLTNHIENRKMRMRAESDDHFRLYTWSTLKILTEYISNRHIQSARINSYYEVFIAKYKTTKRKNLPNLLRKLCDNIRSLIN